MRSLTLLLVLALAGAVGLGCKASVEGETKQLDALTGKVAKYGGKYPNFKSLLDTKLGETKKAFEDAKGGGDEAADKMRKANAIVGDTVSKLDAYQSKRDELKKKMDDRRLNKLKSGEVKDATKKAKKALKKAKEKLENAKPTSIGELNEIIVDARGILITGGSKLDALLRKAGGKKKKLKLKKKKKK